MDPKVTSVLTDNHDSILRARLADLGLNKDSRILNIACEYRLVPEFLANLVNPANVFGIELNEEIVKRNPNIRLCNVDDEAFPFPDEHFDFVISIWGIEHFQKDNIFRQSHRVLKKGGRMVFLTPNLRHPIFLFNRFTAGKVSKFYYKYLIRSPYVPHQTHYRFNTAGKVRQLAAALRFDFEQITYIGPSNILEYFSYSRLLQGAARQVDRCLTNRWLCGIKPYICCVLKKGGSA